MKNFRVILVHSICILFSISIVAQNCNFSRLKKKDREQKVIKKSKIFSFGGSVGGMNIADAYFLLLEDSTILIDFTLANSNTKEKKIKKESPILVRFANEDSLQLNSIEDIGMDYYFGGLLFSGTTGRAFVQIEKADLELLIKETPLLLEVNYEIKNGTPWKYTYKIRPGAVRAMRKNAICFLELIP